MMIISIVGIGIISTVLAVLLRQLQKPELALLVSLATGIIIFSMILDKLKYVIDVLNSLVAKTNVEFAYFSVIIKIIGIAYIAEFGAQISKDAGEEAIASKIELGAKVIMMVLALPILLALMDLITKILP
ncbi:MAG: stage III sporulation protein AD [Tissierellia bacterium]|nr:stage III sporulation protein AD [Tissierellia bacterium]